MIVKNFKVIHVKRDYIADFTEKWHYSANINGVICDHCFGLFNEGELIGAAIFGKMAMANQWKRFSDNPEKVIELRRLCCIDDTPKNTESYFIGKCLKWLTENTKIDVVASYSDLEYGHEGVIYKASNFECLGVQKGAKVIIYNGKSYHDKAIRTKYNGTLKPFAQRIKDALETGEAYYKDTKGKVAYQYTLKRKKTKADYNSVLDACKVTLADFFV
jgi:hypothetical protein